MSPLTIQILCFLAGLLIGAVSGALVMKNNYKHFRVHEAEIGNLIISGTESADKIVMRLRNRMKV